MKPFEKLVKGDTPTFLDADFANRVITFLNGIIEAKVTPAGAGKLVVTETGVTLDLSQAKATSQTGVAAGSNIDAQVAALQGQVAAIITSLKNATITATCEEGTGVITITIAFPNLPG